MSAFLGLAFVSFAAWVLYSVLAKPLCTYLKVAEWPGALLVCASGRQRRRALCRVLARRREAARLLPPLPRPEKSRHRVTAAGPPRRLPAPPAVEQLARADAALAADLAEFTRASSALAEACALLARGLVSRDEARDRAAAVPWPPRPGAGTEMFDECAAAPDAGWPDPVPSEIHDGHGRFL